MSCPREVRPHLPPPSSDPLLAPVTALLQRVNQVQGEADKLKSGNETLQTCKHNRLLLLRHRQALRD